MWLAGRSEAGQSEAGQREAGRAERGRVGQSEAGRGRARQGEATRLLYHLSLVPSELRPVNHKQSLHDHTAANDTVVLIIKAQSQKSFNLTNESFCNTFFININTHA